MTLEEYLATPETLVPQELILGTVRVADAPFVNHQRIVIRLALALEQAARQHGGEVLVAPIDVILDAERALVLQPDVLFVSTARAGIVRERIYGAPDLVVEVLSPRPRIGDIHERVRWFAEYGVTEIWLCRQTEETIEVLSCEDRAVAARRSYGHHMAIRSRVLPQFEQAVASLFRRYS